MIHCCHGSGARVLCASWWLLICRINQVLASTPAGVLTSRHVTWAFLPCLFWLWAIRHIRDFSSRARQCRAVFDRKANTLQNHYVRRPSKAVVRVSFFTVCLCIYAHEWSLLCSNMVIMPSVVDSKNWGISCKLRGLITSWWWLHFTETKIWYALCSYSNRATSFLVLDGGYTLLTNKVWDFISRSASM